MYRSNILNSLWLSRSFVKNCSTKSYNKEFTVSTFCNLIVNIPHNTTIKPLDLFKYQNYDKIIINCSNNNIECIQSGDTINVTSSNFDINDAHCEIEAPVKTNLNITSMKNIIVSNFNGDMINLYSETGNIKIKKCQSNNISVRTNDGDINTEGVIQAANIMLETKKSGNIIAGRLQGLKLLAATDDGNITTESSYCDESTFQTRNGNLKLQNTHKNSNISITNKGNLTMTGCDGSFNITLEKGVADIQVSRIQNDSKIAIIDTGTLILRLAESSQETTSVEIGSKDIIVDNNINLHKTEVNNKLLLEPKHSNTDSFNIIVDCEHSKVNVKTASWSEMFKISFQENSKEK